MNSKEILNQLPSSWDGITLKQFQELTKIKINTDEFAGMDNTISVISVLTNIPVEDLEGFPMKDLFEFGNKIQFIMEEPKPNGKSTLNKWKDIDEINYNDFIVFIKMEDILDNLDEFVKQFSKTELSKEQILELPITDVLNGFFLCRKKLRLYLKHLEVSMKIQIKKQLKQERKALKLK